MKQKEVVGCLASVTEASVDDKLDFRPLVATKKIQQKMQLIVGADPQKDSLYIYRKDDTRDFPKTDHSVLISVIVKERRRMYY